MEEADRADADRMYGVAIYAMLIAEAAFMPQLLAMPGNQAAELIDRMALILERVQAPSGRNSPSVEVARELLEQLRQKLPTKP